MLNSNFRKEHEAPYRTVAYNIAHDRGPDRTLSDHIRRYES
jgi:hypothetical protein